MSATALQGSPSSSTGIPAVRVAGWACVVAGAIGVISALVTGFIPPAVAPGRYSYPYTPTGFLTAQAVFILNHVLLLIGLTGLLRSGATGPGRTGRTGVWAAVSGMAGLTVCEVAALTFADAGYPSPGTATLDTWFGVTTMLIGLGLIVAGVAIVRARRWHGWARFLPLACGVAVFVIVIPGVFGPFLAGRLALGFWMAMFTALGVALIRHGTPPRLGGRGNEAPGSTSG